MDYLMHHGVLGQKWGVRKQKPTHHDGLNEKDQKLFESTNRDLKVKKGEKFSRVYVAEQHPKASRLKKKTLAKRTYVSSDWKLYAYDIDNPMAQWSREVRYKEYIANKDMRIAGRQALDDAMKSIGAKPIKYYQSNAFLGLSHHPYVNKRENTDRDFMDLGNRKYQKIANKVIDKLRDKGYQGMFDPEDTLDRYSYKPMVLFNEDSDFWKEIKDKKVPRSPKDKTWYRKEADEKIKKIKEK